MDIILTDNADNQTLSPGELEASFSLFALRGNDTVTGSSSDELIFGGKDNDQLYLEGGNDEANGNNERDLVVGGDGNDTLRGGKDSDLIVGGSGNDLLFGDRAGDLPIGNEGADTFGLFADDTGNGVDLLLDFDAAEGDRLALLGDLTPDQIVIQEVPIPSIDTISALFPPELSLAEVLSITQIPQDLFETASPELGNFALLTPSGQSIAQIFLTTEADIRNSFVELS